MVLRFGVDEAGKGPVFGPMVVCALVADPATLPTGIDDSKQLTENQRMALARQLRENDDVRINTIHVSPTRIDEHGNLGDLTIDAFAEALAPLVEEGMGGTVDASDTDEERFRRRIEAKLSTPVEMVSRHGADEDDPIVGAASIIAKVERDGRIAELADEYGEIGSGYPSDGRTRAFLYDYVTEHGELPPFARASWSTAEDALEQAGQRGLDEF